MMNCANNSGILKKKLLTLTRRRKSPKATTPNPKPISKTRIPTARSPEMVINPNKTKY
jgi:hypothetical protein